MQNRIFDESIREDDFQVQVPWRGRSAKKKQNLVFECLKADKLELVSRCQVRDADYCEDNS